MTRGAIEVKGRRYLVEGRLILEHVDRDAGYIRALCRGSGAIYALGYDRFRSWHCSCPARSRCCHLVALQLITVAKTVSNP